MSWKRIPGRFLRVSLEESFERFAQKTPQGCWLWQARCKKRGGYGILRRGTKEYLAHRISWQIQNGPIPKGMMVCHRCDVPACVNPAHLFLGTALDNNRDRALKGRSSSRAGESAPCSKLTAQAVLDIRASLMSSRQLALRYGVGEGAISRVKSGRTWKHIPFLGSAS